MIARLEWIRFCKGSLYHPVPYELMPVKPGNILWQEQFWAEPDIKEAAKILTKVVSRRKREGIPNQEISKNIKDTFLQNMWKDIKKD